MHRNDDLPYTSFSAIPGGLSVERVQRLLGKTNGDKFKGDLLVKIKVVHGEFQSAYFMFSNPPFCADPHS